MGKRSHVLPSRCSGENFGANSAPAMALALAIVVLFVLGVCMANLPSSPTTLPATTAR